MVLGVCLMVTVCDVYPNAFATRQIMSKGCDGSCITWIFTLYSFDLCLLMNDNDLNDFTTKDNLLHLKKFVFIK